MYGGYKQNPYATVRTRRGGRASSIMDGARFEIACTYLQMPTFPPPELVRGGVVRGGAVRLEWTSAVWH